MIIDELYVCRWKEEGAIPKTMPLKKVSNESVSEEYKREEILPMKAARQPMIQWVISDPKYALDDLILDTETTTQLLDAISYFKNRELLFQCWGLSEKFFSQSSMAVNLYGPPGTGKTVAAHAIVHELQSKMICVDYAEIESKYVGETSKNLTRLFQLAEKEGAVIFFDEADALLSKRVTNMTSATDVSVNQTRSVLLNLLNQYQGVIIFATNFIQNFDPAFLRRIKYHVQFHLPDEALREQLWKMYIPQKMPSEVDCGALAKQYSGISGSDIANAVFTAAVSAARDGEKVVAQKRFETAIQRCLAVKEANKRGQVTVSKRILSEDEVKEKLGAEGYNK